jgi:hypothetical protein
VSGSGSASNLQIPIFGICPSGRNRLSSAKNKIPRFWPPIPAELRRLIREISRDTSLWGEE